MCYDPIMQLISERKNLRSLPEVSFATLMELYEANYMRLRRLIPDLDRRSGHAVSRIADGLDLHLHVAERSRFTTTITLSHGFEGGGLDARPMPALTIRVYHDARLVEAMSPHACAGSIDLTQRWRDNRYLQHWLQHCLTRKHRFQADTGHASASCTGSGLPV